MIIIVEHANCSPELDNTCPDGVVAFIYLRRIQWPLTLIGRSCFTPSSQGKVVRCILLESLLFEDAWVKKMSVEKKPEIKVRCGWIELYVRLRSILQSLIAELICPRSLTSVFESCTMIKWIYRTELKRHSSACGMHAARSSAIVISVEKLAICNKKDATS